MRYTLKDYQAEAVGAVLRNLAQAKDMYQRYGSLSQFSLSATTGAGKTVMAAAVIEALISGSDEFDFPADSGAVVLWFSDDPSLNEQSRARIQAASSELDWRLKLITNDFRETSFRPGHVYFLNTQKLSKTSNLVKGAGARLDPSATIDELTPAPDEMQSNIYDTIINTIENKELTLYLVLDEAHRGMKPQRDRSTIVQRLINGQGQVPPIPIVFGISATVERFDQAMKSVTNRTALPSVEVDSALVQASGLLKDDIVLSIPAESGAFDTVLLRRAVDKIREAGRAWDAYTREQEEADAVVPLLVVQMADKPSDETLVRTIDTILESWPELDHGAIANVFGEHQDLKVGGYTIPYIEPQRVQDSTHVQVLIAKSAISTGWDCPRAEVLVSFRPASDPTNITQLLGRMIRTPLARRIPGNEALNSVDCMLPYFDRTTAMRVAEMLMHGATSKDDEGDSGGGEGRRVLFEPVLLHPNPDLPTEVWEKFEALPTVTIPKHRSKPIKRFTALAAALTKDKVVDQALKRAHDELNNVVASRAMQYKAQVDRAREDVLTMSGEELRARLGGGLWVNSSFQLAADTRAITEAYKVAERHLSPALCSSYVDYLVPEDAIEDDLLEAYIEVAAIGLVPDIVSSVEAEADRLARTWLTDTRVDRKNLSDEKQAEYDRFVLRNVDDLARHWDLVVADEAHRLRSFWKGDAKIAQAVSDVMASAGKSLLLTATPLQNRLEELYGLVSVFDPEFFHSIEGFKERYVDHPDDYGNDDLSMRIAHLAKRTLRKDAQKYIRFTERMPLTFGFMPSPAEQDLYNKVNSYLQRPFLYAFASSQRHLSALILRKRLGSSTYAVASTLEGVANRLEAELESGRRRSNRGALVDEDMTDEEIEASESALFALPSPEQSEAVETARKEIAAEVAELRSYAALARSITVNQKALKLLDALDQGFAKLAKIGAPQKAIIFTDSTKTQEYLATALREGGRGDGLVLFNGANNSPEATEIYRAWLETNAGSDLITGNPSADRRKALVDEFRERGTIMIATEAAAEGINLQFCSMLVNYDLPWNPQRVEQRIGRVHRFGQQHNVIVVNFSNQGNLAEERILELLTEKFNLFTSVFGASDEVLGSIEDGLYFEKSIAAILERCRTADEINDAFNELERQYEAEISQEMRSTRARVFDNLDPNVQDKLKSYDTQQDIVLSRFEQLLLRVTRRQLDSFAEFDSDGHNFTLTHAPAEGIPTGKYFFKSKPQLGAHQYRYGSDLGRLVVQTALAERTPAANLVFSIAASDRVASAARELVGERGILTAELLTFRMYSGSDTVTESYVLSAGRTDSGKLLDAEQVEQLLDLTCVSISDTEAIDTSMLQAALMQQSEQFNGDVQNRTAQFSIEQGDLVESRLKDHKAKYDAEVRKLNKEEEDARARERRTDDLSERLKLRKEAQRLARRAESLYDDFKVERDRLRQQADDYLEMIEQALKGTDEREHILTIRWAVEAT